MSSGVETSLTIFHERRAQNFGTARDDDRHRTAAALRVACTRDGDLENLAGSAVRRRPACGERVLLRCRSSPPDLARGFRENRGRDEKGDQTESSTRPHGSVTQEAARAWKLWTIRCATSN